MRFTMPLLRRFFGKLIHDIMPAALASLLGGFLITHFQLNRPPEPVTVPVAHASPEMMQLLRDEHGLIGSFVKAQIANEKNAIDKKRERKEATARQCRRQRGAGSCGGTAGRRGRAAADRDRRRGPGKAGSGARQAAGGRRVAAGACKLAGPAERKRTAAAGGA